MRKRTEKAAFKRSIEMVPQTCGPVKDVIDTLSEKYQITEDDQRFAYSMLTKITVRLRRALVRALTEGSR